MRTVLIADILTVARVLAALSPPERPTCLATLIDRAHVAHKISKRLGRPDRRWGDGSLTSAAQGLPRRREPLGLDAEYMASLALVTSTLAWRARRQQRLRRAQRLRKICRRHPLPLLPRLTMC